VSEAVAAILVPAMVVTLDAAGTIGRLAVAVDQGRIAAIGTEQQLRQRRPDLPVLACPDRILMPGLVNAHIHPELVLLKGLVEGIELRGWGAHGLLNRTLARLNSPDGQRLQRIATRAALAECALAGSTCVFTYGVSAGSEQRCAETLAEFGLRGAITIRDARFPEQVDGLPPEGRYGEPGRPLRLYRLHAEETLFEAELAAAQQAHDRGARLIMHAAETRHRLDIIRERFGTSTIRLLERWRLLSPRLLLSHAVHVDDEEIAMIAAAGTPVIASPAAEMKLGDGSAPFKAMIDAGINVALGTDAAVCNNSADLLLECRQLGLLQALRYGPGALTAERILRCATRDGASAVGGLGEFGAIEEGWAADLVLVDAANSRATPMIHDRGESNVCANLVYSLTAQDVTDAMVAGRWTVRHRELRAADAARIRHEFADAAAAIFHDIA
jgi:5-methylthioadenosine/S-adenosylhomocysteine deaminase